MSKVIDYDIVQGISSGALVCKTIEYIKDGWRPYGAPFTEKNDSRTKVWFQAMVKED